MMDYGLAASVLTLLGGAIATLWRNLHAAQLATEKKLEAKLDHCEIQHKDANDKILSLAVEIAEVRGRQEGVNSLAQEVLKVVSGKNND